MRKNSIKNTRINGEVLRELSNIIRGEIKDPRINPMTSVVTVEVADNVLWHLLFIFITIFTTVILTEITFENIQKVRFILECV